MPMLLRHLASILLLPCMAALVLPAWLRSLPGDTRWADGVVAWVARGAGVALIVAGVALVAWCVVLFARVGRGTLAPWDPTRRLVAVGPYTIVRNPMITGVVLALAGQALAWGSRYVATWAGAFFLVNHCWFLFVEELGLRRRFGDEYGEYVARVPRWLPRWP